jgi:hypothetical protein
MPKDDLKELFAFDVVTVVSVFSLVNLRNNPFGLSANDSFFRLQKPRPSSSSYPMCAGECSGNTSGLRLTLNFNLEGRCLHAELFQLERYVVLHLKLPFNIVSYDVDK